MIIGIAGRMGSGKDTVAEYLEYVMPNANVCHFADKLKEMARELFGVTKKDPRGREILQQLGMKMREIEPNVWINYLLNNLSEYKQYVVKFDTSADNDIFIIADCRFPNEAKAILERGGCVIVLDVPDKVRKERIMARDGNMTDKQWYRANGDASEKGIDGIIAMESKFEKIEVVKIFKQYNKNAVNRIVTARVNELLS